MSGVVIELVTRPWMRAAALLVVLLIVGAGLQQNRASLRAYQQWADSFGQPVLRDAYLILSDIARVERAMHSGYTGAAQADDTENQSSQTDGHVRMALDFLWLRSEDFANLRLPPRLESERARVQAALSGYIDAVNAFIARRAASFDDLARIDERGEEVRRQTANLVEEWRTMNVRDIAEKRVALRNSVFRSDVFILFSGALVMTVLLLLGREVAARKAQEAAEAKARRLAYLDPLTGIPNRLAYVEAIEDWMSGHDAGGVACTLVLIDLDNFKEVNDTLGHSVGDTILITQARRIRAIAAEVGGTAARLSGDEFAVILPFVGEARIAAFSEKMLAGLRHPMETGAERVMSQGTMGLCSTTQVTDHGDLLWETMQRAADFALYAAKKEARGTYRCFDETLRTEFEMRRVLLAELPNAIRTGQVTPYFQPKVDIATGRVRGFEALARWQRNGRLVPPGDFIGLAEEAGMVEEIDLAILRCAATEIAACNERLGTRYSISSNLSAKHFLAADTADRVRHALGDIALPPELITLEITESVHLADWGHVVRAITDLQALGYRIAIDDFGSGYSSLSYLRAMKVQEIKIDRSFLEELEESEAARFLLDSVIDLAKGLGMDIIVEGIETRDQEALVYAMGCPTGQGFLYGRPAPIDEALEGADKLPARSLDRRRAAE